MAAYDFPDTAGKPTDGSFEYTAPDGTLYEWNGYAWVVPSGDDAGSGSGGAARVLTQVLPPSPAVDGDMYWCTDDGRLYLYYDDADTSQWVDASPDNAGGSGTDAYWARNGTTLEPANDGDMVVVGTYDESSDTTKGTRLGLFAGNSAVQTQVPLAASGSVGVYDVYHGSNKTINFTCGGSAEFAGNILNGNFDLTNANTSGVRILASGGLQLQRDSSASNSARFQIIRGTNDETVTINSDGSAEFAGSLSGGQLYAYRPSTTATHYIFSCRSDIGGTKKNKAIIYANGDAKFAGNVTQNESLSRSLIIQTETDNPANFTTDLDEEGNETQTYTGPTLDVKDRVLNLISRLDAIEANEIIDDATDTSLLQLLASASSRLDSIESRLTALEGGSN